METTTYHVCADCAMSVFGEALANHEGHEIVSKTMPATYSYFNEGSHVSAVTGKSVSTLIINRVPADHRAEVGLLSNFLLNTRGGRPSDAAREAFALYCRLGVEGVREYASPLR